MNERSKLGVLIVPQLKMVSASAAEIEAEAVEFPLLPPCEFEAEDTFGVAIVATSPELLEAGVEPLGPMVSCLSS